MITTHDLTTAQGQYDEMQAGIVAMLKSDVQTLADVSEMILDGLNDPTTVRTLDANMIGVLCEFAQHAMRGFLLDIQREQLLEAGEI